MDLDYIGIDKIAGYEKFMYTRLSILNAQNKSDPYVDHEKEQFPPKGGRFTFYEVQEKKIFFCDIFRHEFLTFQFLGHLFLISQASMNKKQLL